MLNRLLGAAVVLATMTSAVCAADLPLRSWATPPLLPIPFTWTGLYAGLNVGYGFAGNDSVHTDGQAAPNIANIAGGARPGFVGLDRSGVTAGGQIGYNYQIGRFVGGIETDIAYTDFRDRRNIGTTQLVTGLPLNNNFRSDIDFLGTVRGRLGVTYDRALFYATGGLAYGDTKHSVTMFGPTGNVQFAGDRSETKVGYAVGAGLEYALYRNLSVKAEYLYYNLGRDTVNVAVIPGSGGAGTGYNSHFQDSGNLVRVGLNYKFY